MMRDAGKDGETGDGTKDRQRRRKRRENCSIFIILSEWAS